MQVSVEKVSNVERRLTIVVPSEEVEKVFNQEIQQFAKTAKIKGFRPGKVPVNYIKKYFGDDARRRALGEVIQRSFQDALAQEKLQPINTPSIEPKEIEANKPLEFVATFEVLPEIEKIQFALEQIEKPTVEIKPEDVQYVIAQLLKQYTNWKLVEREAKDKDRVVIDYYAVFEGKADEQNKVENAPLELGSKIMLPGFEEGLMGTKVGDEKTLHLQFPDDYTVKENAGKPVDFVIKVKEIFEAETPPLDKDFITQVLGIKSGSEEDLKTQIKQTLELESQRLIQEKLKDQIFRELLDKNKIDIPNSLIAREARNIHDEIYPKHQHEHLDEHSENEINALNEVAKKRVTLGLLLSEYAKQSHLQVDNARLVKRIQEIASSYEHPKQVIDWLSSTENRKNIEAQVMEELVIEKLMEGLSVKEKEMSYADIKGISQT